MAEMVGVTFPRSLSKSMEKASGCERYLCLHYLDETMPPRASSAMAETGTDFHAYRAAYIDHLVKVVRPQDPDWVDQWLETNPVSDDARDLIERDAARFYIDPDKVFATELFLSVDSHFQRLENEQTPEPGRPPADPNSFAHGTIDLLEIDGEQATIVDAKSGWSTQAVKPYEGLHYAVLVFAHFPYVNRVTFYWDFIRAEGLKPLTFERSELESMQKTVRARHRHIQDIAHRYELGKEPATNIQAGLCGFCDLTCPIRDTVKRKLLEFPPLQNLEDAKRVAELVYMARCTAATGDQLLKAWIDQNGPVDLGGGVIAEMVLGKSDSFPLRPVLSVLGFDDIPEKSKKWDVPLESLLVGTAKLKSYANAKKRAGLREALDQIAVSVPTSTLKVHRKKNAPKPDANPEGAAA
jgi:hypothetical protein